MPSRFPMTSRLLHWTMAVMVLAMLFIGIAMVRSLADYHRLVAIHRPLGILILVLVALRLANRLIRPAPPPLPLDMPGILRLAAHARMRCSTPWRALPLVGWTMLSAAGNPSCSSAPGTCRRFCRRAMRSTPCCGHCIPCSPSCCSPRSSSISERR
jgi:cytochrome b561